MEGNIEYRRKDGISGSYIIFEINCENEESVEVKMIQNNDILGILSCDFRYEDNRLYLYYDTTNKMAVCDIIKGKEISYELLVEIYKTFIQTMKSCEKYLISADSILFRKDFIYGNNGYRKFKLCVLPGFNSPFRKQIKNLTEEFMKIADHSDRRCVEFIYGMYDIVSEDNFHANDIEMFIAGRGNAETILEKDKSDGYILDNDDHSYNESTEQNKKQICAYDKSECFSLVRRNIKNPLIIEFVPEIINVKKSLSFGCGTEDIVHLGRSHDNEITFPHNYISRKHAVLEADENFLYVTDKGSLNGTFVNKERIAANVKTRCKVKDEITFADISFIVT